MVDLYTQPITPRDQYNYRLPTSGAIGGVRNPTGVGLPTGPALPRPDTIANVGVRQPPPTAIGAPVSITNPAQAKKPGTVPAVPTGGVWVRPGEMSQDFYLKQAAAGLGDVGSGGLGDFLRDWATKGGRGIQGGNGADASYESVLMDLANRGYDVSTLPQHGYNGPTAEQMGALPAQIQNMLNMQRSDARAQYGAMLAQLQQQESDTTRNRDESVRQYGIQSDAMRGQLPSNYLNRGIYNSGIWQGGLADFQTARQTGLDNLRNQYLTLLNGIQSQRAGADQTLQSILSGIDQDELQRKADQIASLKNAGLT